MFFKITNFAPNFVPNTKTMEVLKHECGVAMVRLLKPLEYYQQKYGTWMYGLNKMYLLMEKQHNRGQEGAGIACVKLDAASGEEYMFRERALGTGAITEIFETIHSQFSDLTSEELNDAVFAKKCLPFAGDLYMGHLRYSTTGKSGLAYVHPFLRRNNWRARNLAVCGNFNLTNVDEVFAKITNEGQHPRRYADTYIILEQLGHRLDREVEHLYDRFTQEGKVGLEVTHAIEDNVDMSHVLQQASKDWDGGYVMCGITGSGESFAVRDPWGIRSAFWYMDEEIMVLASERPVIQTVLNVTADQVNELLPGQAILVNRSGHMRLSQINEPKELHACSFERIYFSRGSDIDIYRERKKMGLQLIPSILKAINYDVEHTVFSFIPNTAEVAFYGMLEGLGITVDVALHLDHGSYEGALKCIEAGFSSVMFDGSHYPIAENIEKTKTLVKICAEKGLSLEAEVGAIGGEEDGVVGMGECADPEECKMIADLGVTMLAAGIGNIHGKYPANWPGLSFETLAAVSEKVGNMPLVLHGGTGIPADMIKKAISLGVSKINVNTECQLAFQAATRKYIEAGKDLEGKGFDPRKLLAPGFEAIKATVKEKMELFGSVGKN